MAISEGRSGRGALLPLRISQLAGSRGGSLAIFVGKRILWMVPIVFFVILITFVLMHLAPGSPWDRTGGRQLSQAVMNNLNIKYGLDKPETEQFKLYVWNVIHFDFGLSYQYEGKSVVTLIGGGWPYTATIGFLAFLLIVPVGISLGVVAALRQNTRVDYITMGFATFAASFPNFVIGALMVVVF
ncbi:MAG: ABC transporter permease, partial [Chloroflexi bacterium]